MRNPENKPFLVAILNYNGKHWLEQFLPSVIEHSKELATVVVIDNGSSDGSEAYADSLGNQILWHSLPSNLGFTGGYNQGLRDLEHHTFWKYTVLLNSDVETTPGWLDAPFAALEGNENIGVCQPTILNQKAKNQYEYAGAAGGFLDQFGFPFCRGRIADTIEEISEDYQHDIDVFWASGAAFIVRSSLYAQMRGLDESYFAHFEEIDLCWRIQNAGFSIRAIANSKVYHVGGGTLSYQSSRKVFLNFRNSLSMLYKNLSVRERWRYIPLRLFMDAGIAWSYVFQGKPQFFLEVIKAHWAFFGRIFSGKLTASKVLGFPKSIFRRSILVDYKLKGKTHFRDLNL